ncbi:MAG: hypothetical protein IDH49_00580 [Gammaproteobacteria bacterium]|nr:hypothetical protein [Gammaproteobacteria bacterium]
MEPINELDESLMNVENDNGRNAEEEERNEIHLKFIEEDLIEEIFSGMAWNG